MARSRRPYKVASRAGFRSRVKSQPSKEQVPTAVKEAILVR